MAIVSWTLGWGDHVIWNSSEVELAMAPINASCPQQPTSAMVLLSKTSNCVICVSSIFEKYSGSCRKIHGLESLVFSSLIAIVQRVRGRKRQSEAKRDVHEQRTEIEQGLH